MSGDYDRCACGCPFSSTPSRLRAALDGEDNQTRRWATYSGPSPHLDHVHIALNTSGADDHLGRGRG